MPFRVLAEKARRAATTRSGSIAHCDYGYTSDLSLQSMLDDDVLVAWAHGGEPLTGEHGFPLRLVVPEAVRVEEREVATGGSSSRAQNKRGFWEAARLPHPRRAWAEERYSYQEGPRAELEP